MLSPTSSMRRARGAEAGAAVPSVRKPTKVRKAFALAPPKDGSSTEMTRMFVVP